MTIWRIGVATMLSVLSGTAVAAFAQSAQPAERFLLSGLVVMDEGQGIAWLQEPSLTQNQVVTVRRGDSIGPWKLTAVLSDRVELEGPSGKIFVPLSGPEGTATAAAPGGATPAAVTRAASPVRTEAPTPPNSAAAPVAQPAGPAPTAAAQPSSGQSTDAMARFREMFRQPQPANAPSSTAGVSAPAGAQAPGSSPSVANPSDTSAAAGAGPSFGAAKPKSSAPLGDPSRRAGMRELFGVK